MGKIYINKAIDFLIIIIICYILYEIGYDNGRKSKDKIKEKFEIIKTDTSTKKYEFTR